PPQLEILHACQATARPAGGRHCANSIPLSPFLFKQSRKFTLRPFLGREDLIPIIIDPRFVARIKTDFEVLKVHRVAYTDTTSPASISTDAACWIRCTEITNRCRLSFRSSTPRRPSKAPPRTPGSGVQQRRIGRHLTRRRSLGTICSLESLARGKAYGPCPISALQNSRYG